MQWLFLLIYVLIVKTVCEILDVSVLCDVIFVIWTLEVFLFIIFIWTVLIFEPWGILQNCSEKSS